MKMYWNNFRTGEVDAIEQGDSNNWEADKFRDYLPQPTDTTGAAAQNLYSTLLQQGETPSEAYVKTLQAIVGERHDRA